MTFIEFIGFVISFIALIFLFTKRVLEQRKQRVNPEEYERHEVQQEENLRKLLKSVDMRSKQENIWEEDDDEKEEEEVSPTPERISQPPKHQQALIKLRNEQKLSVQQKKTPSMYSTGYGVESASELKHAALDTTNSQRHGIKPADSYEVARIEQISAGMKLIRNLPASRDMLIIKEIFDAPLSLRNPRDDKW